MTAKKNEEVIVDVEEAYTKTERYIQDNQKTITLVIGALVAVIGLYFSYKYLYMAPKEQEASALIWKAERNFELDSFRLALYGDLVNPGFEEIASNYGSTRAGNLAKYYAGICNLNMGDFERAIDYFGSYDPVDETLGPMSIGLIGDANMELGDANTALDYYLKAAKEDNNDFTSPYWYMKAARTHEMLGEYGSALELYEKIRKDYPTSNESNGILKHISRAQARA